MDVLKTTQHLSNYQVRPLLAEAPPDYDAVISRHRGARDLSGHLYGDRGDGVPIVGGALTSHHHVLGKGSLDPP